MRETTNLEYKREVSKTYLKTVSAFANYGTGEVLFGVADDGAVLGIADPAAACLRIENEINDSLNPVPLFSLNVDGDTRVITLTVQEGPEKPYLYKGKAYRRADSSTVEVGPLELRRLVLLGTNTTFDAVMSNDQDLSFKILERELQRKIGLDALDKNALISLELANSSGLFNNAAALLADENHFPGIDIARFGPSINIILSRRTIEKSSLLTQMSEAMAAFDEYYSYEVIEGAKRISKCLIPREAFREAVANALVHRRWDVPASIKISMFENRIEVSSPGSLPEDLSEEAYRAGGPSIARNPVLANVFYRLGYIERFGTGIPRILEAYATMIASPTFAITPSSITVTLPIDEENIFSDNERLMLNALTKGTSFSRAEISEATGMSKDKAIRVLNDLLEKNAIFKTGSGRSVRYARR